MGLFVDDKKVKQIVLDAGEIARKEAKHCDVFTKGRADFVTQADLNIQAFIKESLQEEYPDIGFQGEEDGDDICADGIRWILDPIDGTTNYIYNYNHSAISLALRNGNETAFGVIYNPFTDEMFSAVHGEGAFLNDMPIHVNKAESLDNALVAVGTSPYYKEMAPEVFRKIEKIYSRSLDIRRGGSAALDLAYVACGRLDAYFEYRLKPWDYAAGNLIVMESGGVVSSISEDTVSYERASDIAACTNKELMKEMLLILNENKGELQ